MNVYIYNADIFCEDCGQAIRKRLSQEGKAPLDLEDTYSYDSDDYPAGPYSDGGGQADCPQHCGSGSGCLNAIELPSGGQIGAWLGNSLTVDGVEYVRETIRCGGEVAALWAALYDDSLLNPFWAGERF